MWAPKRKAVDLMLEVNGESSVVPMSADERGYFSVAARAPEGALYKYRLDGGDAFPDPASRFQPRGPHEASRVVDPRRFTWTDRDWAGIELEGQVIYELHVGTFTKEGTWNAATEQLPELARLGISVLEIMPIAEFPGKFGWGYDGVSLFAPCHLYGEPDDLRRFVDRAHALGMGVILDVVYNHLGPDGNYLPQYSDHYFTDTKVTDWGDPVNYDSEDSHGVRAFVCDNAAYWVSEFHFDGLRLDATQNIYDTSEEHILAAIGKAARTAAGKRSIIFVAENESQEAKLVRPLARGGYGLDALWNDDFHHSAKVTLTGRREAYYTDYRGSPQELLSALKHGYLYQGQRYTWQKQRRGRPALDLPSKAFVTFLDNHDQVSNSPDGARGHVRSSPSLWRVMTGLFLLGPGTPMLFQGQEFSSSAPFLFFADHHNELAEAIRVGRADFLAQFPSMASPEARAKFDAPSAPSTFERCKLDFDERTRHAPVYAMHRQLLKLRKAYQAIRNSSRFDGAVLSLDSFCMRWMNPSGTDLLAVVNLGEDQGIFLSDPLLAPPEDCDWRVVWNSEDLAWGGSGATRPEDSAGRWRLTSESMVLLESRRSTESLTKELI
ncbi:MAG: malto-oligosyltrehalose trehalohydrolase [Polyangiaceae bacterium]